MELECLKVQVTKYETLSRVRADRISELEQQVIALSGSQGSMEKELDRVSEELREALAMLDNLAADNKMLKAENQQVSDLRRKLQQERELGLVYQKNSQPRSSAMFSNTYARNHETPRPKSENVGIQTDEPLK